MSQRESNQQWSSLPPEYRAAQPEQQAGREQAIADPPIQMYPRQPQYAPGIEPGDVGPSAGGDLRVADSDRDLCLEVLNTAYAEGRITAGEHAERINAASRARIFDDLIPLTRDLVPEGPVRTAELSTASTARGPRIEPSQQQTQADTMMAVLGDHTRNGTWRVRRNLQTYVLLGDIDLDFTDAIFESDTIEIEGAVGLGDLSIRVPEGVNVQLRTSTLLGDAKVKGLGETAPGGPTIVIKTFILLGDVKVHGPEAGPTRREKRRERRARRHGCGH